MVRTIIALCIPLLFLSTTSTALACSCRGEVSPEDALERASAVFSGTVVSLSHDRQKYQLTATIRVERIWKGPDKAVLTVTTSLSSASCGYGFRKDVDYLVYAYGDNGQLSTGLCSGTKVLDRAARDLEIFGDGKVPSQTPGAIDALVSVPVTPAVLVTVLEREGIVAGKPTELFVSIKNDSMEPLRLPSMSAIVSFITSTLRYANGKTRTVAPPAYTSSGDTVESKPLEPGVALLVTVPITFKNPGKIGVQCTVDTRQLDANNPTSIWVGSSQSPPVLLDIAPANNARQ